LAASSDKSAKESEAVSATALPNGTVAVTRDGKTTVSTVDDAALKAASNTAMGDPGLGTRRIGVGTVKDASGTVTVTGTAHPNAVR
jgi:hypothetical protein